MAYTRPPVATKAGQGLKQTPVPATQAIVPVVLDCEIASATQLGVVKQGINISIAPDGTISAVGGSNYIYDDWVPTIISTGTIPISIRNAKYIKIGPLVTCTFDIKITNIIGGTNSALLSLGGLPYTSIVSTGVSGSLVTAYWSQLDANIVQLSGTVNSASNTVSLWHAKATADTLARLTQDDVKVNSNIVGTITYMALV